MAVLSMRIIRKPSQFQLLVRKISRPLVLVPTMGALHEGHLALVRKARKLAGKQGAVAASLFVNPTQFGPKEDFSRYPRPFRRDCSLLRKNGCDLLFAPEMGDMYYPDRSTVITENQLSKVMCGASRPGHFDGVCLVVSKLFHIVQPDMGVFGEKDYQQLAILRRMVRDLNFPIRIVSHPTVREADGLAMSSRNNYLSEEERRQAPIIYEAFCIADKKIRAGNISKNQLANWIRQKIESASLAKVDYVDIVNPDDLQPVHELEPPLLLAAAVFFGKIRLIDNRLVK
jgi:pantoate--beta-alanine ligase